MCENVNVGPASFDASRMLSNWNRIWLWITCRPSNSFSSPTRFATGCRSVVCDEDARELRRLVVVVVHLRRRIARRRVVPRADVRVPYPCSLRNARRPSGPAIVPVERLPVLRVLAHLLREPVEVLHVHRRRDGVRRRRVVRLRSVRDVEPALPQLVEELRVVVVQELLEDGIRSVSVEDHVVDVALRRLPAAAATGIFPLRFPTFAWNGASRLARDGRARVHDGTITRPAATTFRIAVTSGTARRATRRGCTPSAEQPHSGSRNMSRPTTRPRIALSCTAL